MVYITGFYNMLNLLNIINNILHCGTSDRLAPRFKIYVIVL